MPSALGGKESILNTMDKLAVALELAKPHKLEYEVLATAFCYLKENPDASIEESLVAGCEEWDL
jgi:hypothetical protein